MFALQILTGPPLDFRAIKIELCESKWIVPPEYDILVDAAWRTLCEREALWDGTYYRVLDPEGLGQRHAMRLGTIRYRYIATYPALHDQHAQCGLEALNHLSTVALIRTIDGFYMFGRRARNKAIEMIGGGVQQDELAVVSGADLEANLYKEIREEVGIGREHIEELHGLGAVRSTTSNVLLVSHSVLRLSRADAATLFAQKTEDELSEIIFVPQSGLRKFLYGLPDYRAIIPEIL